MLLPAAGIPLPLLEQATVCTKGHTLHAAALFIHQVALKLCKELLKGDFVEINTNGYF